MTEECPRIPRNLVEWLEAQPANRDRHPDLDTPRNAIDHKGGRIAVVRMLRQVMEAQEREALGQDEAPEHNWIGRR